MIFKFGFASLVLASSLISIGLPTPVGAQEPPRDYYLAGSSAHTTALLRNVEKNHYRPALVRLQKGQYKYALAELDFVLRYIPNHPHALTKTIDVALGLGRPELAEQRLQHAIEAFPQHGETYVIYGIFLHRRGGVDAAIAQYQKALELDPNLGYAHYNLGLAYVDRKDYERANLHAQKAYQLGVALPALRTKLDAVKAWKALGASDNPSKALEPSR
jgi:tetratricopeptide (TPR) repeat protein